MSRDLNGLSAVITGTGSGIGLATALMMHAEGVEVVGLDIDRGNLPEDIAWIHCDVTSDRDIDNAFGAVEVSHQHINIVVNCAGIGAIGVARGVY
jgi:NAD(P)-dependent dehydrogenase (short-subunit alcohol dehydrogenase family)